MSADTKETEARTPEAPARRSTPYSLSDCAEIPRWVAWRNEPRVTNDGEEKRSKVPIDPATGRYAKVPTDPSTYGTREQAERQWRRLRPKYKQGGIGFVLGPISAEHRLCGIDLDGCIDSKTSQFDDLTRDVIKRFNSYAEYSPSRMGIKIFFLMREADGDSVKQLLGTDEKWKQRLRKTFPCGEHKELAFDIARFYAVTERQAKGAPSDFNIVAVEHVEWLLKEAGPAYQRAHGTGDQEGEGEARMERDGTNSGYAFRFFQDCHRSGDTFERALEKLRADSGPAGDWARYAPDREIKRTWENSKRGINSIHNWEDPDRSLLDDRRGDLPEFPLDALEPEQLRDWVERAAHGAGTSIGHVAVPLLGVASSLIGTARRARPSKSWSQPMTCWTCLVGFSGDGKTPGLNCVRNALDSVQDERQEEIENLRREHDEQCERAKAARAKWKKQVGEATEQGTATPMKPDDAHEPGQFIEPRLFVSDATIEKMGPLLQARPQGMLLLTDELAGWFKNMSRYSGGQDNQFWLMAWDGKSYIIERMGRPSIKLDHLLVGIVGGLQPDRLAEIFKGPADGMYARILFSWPQRPPYRPLTDMIEETDPFMVAVLDKLAGLPKKQPSRVPLTPKAVAEFERLRREIDDGAGALDGREREWWAKVPAHVLRVAGTLAYLRWAVTGGAEPTEITSQYVSAAVRLVIDYFWPHSCAALRQIGLTERHADERRVLRWVVATGCNTVSREIIRCKALRKSLDADAVQGILNALERSGWLRRIERRAGPAGGRPVVRWEVNPRLIEKRR